jgi:2-C-methyl-D-erythritol 2,4-cyclodiphosphate synthase
MRIGLGYDSHRFAKGRRLILGGIEIEHAVGLMGHSDADAIAHALTDALLGACGMGDIGEHFPPSDERWRDADSIELLRHAVNLAAEQNYQIVNADITVVCESPRIAPHVPAMRGRLADALQIAPRLVSVKGKTNEGMGWIGRGEGIAAMAVVLVNRVEG